MQVRWAGDRCSVCDSDVDFDFDQLVSCDACGITVHQSCYGVAELPGVDDMWMCRACELKASTKGGRLQASLFACMLHRPCRLYYIDVCRACLTPLWAFMPLGWTSCSARQCVHAWSLHQGFDMCPAWLRAGGGRARAAVLPVPRHGRRAEAHHRAGAVVPRGVHAGAATSRPTATSLLNIHSRL